MSDKSVKKSTSAIKIGDIFNHWEVTNPRISAPASIKNPRPYAECKCLDCGELKPVNIYDMTRGATKNCGCTRKKDITGQVFGKWTVIKETRFAKNTYYWCRCECGTEKELRGTTLRVDGSNSCGCANKINTVEEAKQRAIDAVFRRYADGNLTIGLFGLLIQLPCFYCGRVGVNYQKPRDESRGGEIYKAHAHIRYNGLDRFSRSHSQHHDQDNVVPCCPNCNFFKLDRSYEEMRLNIPFLQENPQLLTVDKLDTVKNAIRDLENGVIKAKNNKSRSAIGAIYNSTNKWGHPYFQGTINRFFWHRENNPQYTGVEVTLTEIDVAELKLANCVYCTSSANLEQNIANEIDRLDPTQGYTPTNCVSACRACNSAKAELTLPEFLDWIKQLKANFSNLPESSSDIQQLIKSGYFLQQARERQAIDYFDYLSPPHA